MSGEMVRAILDGRKTQTRRELYTLRKGPPFGGERAAILRRPVLVGSPGEWQDVAIEPPLPPTPEHWWALSDWHKVKAGDVLWVREAWRVPPQYDSVKPSDLGMLYDRIEYEADDDGPGGGKLRPSMHMPRWACRLTLHVKQVVVQRLQKMTELDALAEGFAKEFRISVMRPGRKDYRMPLSYRAGAANWFSSHGDRWDDNPWMVAIAFERQP